MEKLIKTTKTVLSGSEKVAILLAEIGPMFNSDYDLLYESLHLSTDEIKKIRKAMKRLGRYSPTTVDYETGMEQIKREQTVLKEALDFGARRGIIHKETHRTLAKTTDKLIIPAELKNLVNQNPEEVAKLLRDWLEKNN